MFIGFVDLKNIGLDTKIMSLSVTVLELCMYVVYLAAILKNGGHLGNITDIKWVFILIEKPYENLHLDQIWRFYHKTHDFFANCPTIITYCELAPLD